MTYVSIASILGLMDLPLSIMADTITLPLTIAAQIEKYKHSNPKSTSTETRDSGATAAKN
jgi:hypothetical protein